MTNKTESQRRDFKSSLFVNMFGRNVNAKEHFLSLYNAIHDTNYRIGEVEIKPVTLDNVLFNDIENDVSMEINDSIVVLAEHQSTINNNMAFRCLEYLVAHYNRFFHNNDKYSTKEIKLPRPECYVFYNGDASFPKEKIMKLSDAFKPELKNKTLTRSGIELPDSCFLDLTVKVYNVNKSANHQILAKCEPLLAFSNFSEYARIAKKQGERNPPKYALERCRKETVLTSYFNNLSKEEQSMIFGEWDQEMFIKVQRKEAFEDGQEQGAREASLSSARNALSMGLTPEQAAQITSLPLKDVLALKETITK